jgi:hypothetical protein
VQYATTQALGLLLRSNPSKWWPRIAPIFAAIISQSKWAMLSKAMVMITYGKMAYYMAPEDPYYKGIIELLRAQSKSENILVAEPAVYGLCNAALAHSSIVRQFMGRLPQAWFEQKNQNHQITNFGALCLSMRR